MSLLRPFALFTVFTILVFAQDPRGTLLGRISDPTGSVIVDAEVRLTNTATGVVSTAKTNDAGNFTVPNLLPGPYIANVERTGFKRFVRQGIEVRGGERLTLDITLEVGAVSDSITVTSEAPLLESTTATVGQIIDNRRLTDLPSPSASVIFQVALTPGVTPLVSPSGNFAPDREGDSNQFAVSGAPSGSNQVMIDGNPTDIRGTITLHAIPEVVEEVQVQTTPIDASAGRAIGAFINMVMKSGTNKFRGDLVYSYIGRTLTSMDFFTKRNLYNPANAPVTEEKKKAAWPGGVTKRYRAALGGPLYIPKLYDGRNRTFWTFGFEAMTSALLTPATTTMPTAAQRAGDFSQLLAVGGQYQIYDPATIAPAAGGRFSRQPIPGNIIPASRVAPIARQLFEYYPLPNLTGTRDGLNNFAYPNVSPQTYDAQMARIDHNISAAQRLYVTITRKFHDHNYDPIGTKAFSSVMDRRQHTIAVSDSITARPDLIFDLRYGIMRYGDQRFSKTRGFDLATLGMPASLVNQLDKNFTTVPRLAINGFFTLGGGAQAGAASTYAPYTYHDMAASAMHLRGNHTFRFGTEFRVNQQSNTNLGNLTPSYSFAETWTRGPLDNSPIAPIGQGLASFVLGLPTGGSIDKRDTSAATSKYHAFYAQDDWKLSRKLTVNLGLRFDFERPTQERFNRTAIGYDFATASPIQDAARANYARAPIAEVPVPNFRTTGGLMFAGVGNSPRGLWDTDWNNLAPRIGFAYLMRPDTVLRGGYAIFFSNLGADTVSVYQPGYTATTSLVPSRNNGQTFEATTQNPFPNGLLPIAGNSNGLATFLGQGINSLRRDMRHPYMQRWSASVQHSLPWRTMFDVAYIGSRAVGLLWSQALNAVPGQYLSTSPVRDQAAIDYLSQQVPNPFASLPQFAGTGLATANVSRTQLLRPFPHFPGISENARNGYSWYHALQARFEKRLSSGFTTTVSYTWSKSMDASTVLNEFEATPYESISSFDRPHNITVSAMYDLPFGYKSRWLSGSRWLDQAVGGWSIQALYIGQSGSPIGFGNIIFNGNIEDIVLPNSQRTVERWFNTEAGFEKTVNRQLGSNVRTFPLRFSGLRTDGMNCANMSLFKTFSFTERVRFQLRAEATNAFNHSMFLSGPTTTPTSTLFGALPNSVAQSNLPRRITVGGKLSW
ncbi:MAG: TonB-dependent receptor [Bryobacterales bacterium]|nr:TonB-dependent receptor [Bryobacterales bacterium]